MQELDIKQLNPEQLRLLNNFINTVKQQGYTRTLFDERRRLVDKALKQEFIDNYDGGWAGVSADYVTLVNQIFNENNAVPNGVEQQPNQPDAFSSLYVPLLLRLFNAWIINIKNLCFPANGDFLSLTREFSQYFYDTGVEDFLPVVNDCWTQIIKTENQRFNIKSTYETALAENIAYGNTVMGHTYNAEHCYIEPFCPGIGTASIFPITDKWRNSNLCFYYDQNYSELLDRTDFDQEVVKALEPSQNTDSSMSVSRLGSTAQQQYKQNMVPFGKVRLYDFFLPSVYLKDGSSEVFIAKNVYLTVALRADNQVKEEARQGEQPDVYILKASQNVDSIEHGILFASFGTSQPGVFYHAGPIQPFLPHQVFANQIMIGTSRMVANIIASPYTENRKDGYISDSTLDGEDTPQEPLIPYGRYKNVDIKPIYGADYTHVLGQFLPMMQYIDNSVETGSGISNQNLAGMNKGRKTAAEIREAYSGAALSPVSGACMYDDQVIRPSHSIRLRSSQMICKEEIDMAVNKILQGGIDLTQTEELPQDEGEAYEMALKSNKLYRRLLNYSGIEAKYTEYYKRKKAEIIQDQQILLELEGMKKERDALLQYANSPILPPPPPMMMQDPVTGAPVAPDPQMVEQMMAQYFQAEQQKRNDALMQAQQMNVEIDIKMLTFKGTKEPPEPSKRLFYELLTAPIEDSDIIVTGAMTTISKELARENLQMMLQTIPAFASFSPETVERIKGEGIFELYARAIDVPLDQIMKSEADLLREKEQQKKAAQYQQQLIAQAAQVPGAQPAQIGRGNAPG